MLPSGHSPKWTFPLWKLLISCSSLGSRTMGGGIPEEILRVLSPHNSEWIWLSQCHFGGDFPAHTSTHTHTSTCCLKHSNKNLKTWLENKKLGMVQLVLPRQQSMKAGEAPLLWCFHPSNGNRARTLAHSKSPLSMDNNWNELSSASFWLSTMTAAKVESRVISVFRFSTAS